MTFTCNATRRSGSTTLAHTTPAAGSLSGSRHVNGAAICSKQAHNGHDAHCVRVARRRRIQNVGLSNSLTA